MDDKILTEINKKKIKFYGVGKQLHINLFSGDFVDGILETENNIKKDHVIIKDIRAKVELPLFYLEIKDMKEFVENFTNKVRRNPND